MSMKVVIASCELEISLNSSMPLSRSDALGLSSSRVIMKGMSKIVLASETKQRAPAGIRQELGHEIQVLKSEQIEHREPA